MRLAAFGTHPVMASPYARLPKTCVLAAASLPDPSERSREIIRVIPHFRDPPYPSEDAKDVWNTCPLPPVAQRFRVAPDASAWHPASLFHQPSLAGAQHPSLA